MFRQMTIALVLAALAGAVSAQEIKLYNYKDNAASVGDVSIEAFKEAWTTTPTCVKDGSKIVGVNKLFKDRELGYRDCSKGKAAAKKHAKLGTKVQVFSLANLPQKIFDLFAKR